MTKWVRTAICGVAVVLTFCSLAASVVLAAFSRTIVIDSNLSHFKGSLTSSEKSDILRTVEWLSESFLILQFTSVLSMAVCFVTLFVRVQPRDEGRSTSSVITDSD